MIHRKQQHASIRAGILVSGLLAALLASPGVLAMTSEQDHELARDRQGSDPGSRITGVAASTGPVGNVLYRSTEASTEPLGYEEAGPVGRLPDNAVE